MDSSGDARLRSLQQRVMALSVRLAEARREVVVSSVSDLEDISPAIDACKRGIADLSDVDRRQMRPLLLALADEVQQTIEAFRDDVGNMRRQLESADRGRAVDAAYRQLGKF